MCHQNYRAQEILPSNCLVGSQLTSVTFTLAEICTSREPEECSHRQHHLAQWRASLHYSDALERVQLVGRGDSEMFIHSGDHRVIGLGTSWMISPTLSWTVGMVFLNHLYQTFMQPALESLAWKRFYHFPGQSAPISYYSKSKEVLSSLERS